MDSRNLGGRPAIGPAFSLRFPTDLLDRVDARATEEHLSRAAWIRCAAEDRLHISLEELSQFVPWLLDQGVNSSEVGRVIEKPWDYQDWLQIHRRDGSLDELDHPLA